MSETDHPSEHEPAQPEADEVSPLSAGTATAANQPTPSHPPLALPATLAPETQALLEMIGRGLAPAADDTARAAARELWSRFAQSIATVEPMSMPMRASAAMPAAPAIPIAMPLPHAIPQMPLPSSPLAMAARALKQMTPDQLIDLLLQRLRSALPAGAQVAAPRGIQFPLVPLPPSSAR